MNEQLNIQLIFNSVILLYYIMNKIYLLCILFIIIYIICRQSYTNNYSNTIVNNNDYLVIQFDNREFFRNENFNNSDFHKLIKINENYCKKYNFDYIFKSTYDGNIPVYWMKVKIITDMLNNKSKYKAIIWLDSDAVFTNINKSILDILNNKSMYISRDPPEYNERVLCVGTWIIKNNEIGIKIMNDWLNSYDPSLWTKNDNKWSTNTPWAGIAYEQGTFNEIIYPKYKDHIDVLPWYIFNNDINNNEKSYISHYMGPKKNLINKHFS